MAGKEERRRRRRPQRLPSLLLLLLVLLLARPGSWQAQGMLASPGRSSVSASGNDALWVPRTAPLVDSQPCHVLVDDDFARGAPAIAQVGAREQRANSGVGGGRPVAKLVGPSGAGGCGRGVGSRGGGHAVEVVDRVPTAYPPHWRPSQGRRRTNAS